jgi:hypothetical protein
MRSIELLMTMKNLKWIDKGNIDYCYLSIQELYSLIFRLVSVIKLISKITIKKKKFLINIYFEFTLRVQRTFQI